MKEIKKKILDDLGDLMNKYIEEIQDEDARTEMINNCLEVLVLFALISSHVAGIDEDTMHDLVHETYADLMTSGEKNADA